VTPEELDDLVLAYYEGKVPDADVHALVGGLVAERPARMSLERAREIASKCLAHVWVREGIKDGPAPSLAEYSLVELLEANHVVAADPGEPTGDGKRRVWMHCDDRLVAALYVGTHYPGCPPDDVDVVAIAAGNAVVVVRAPEPEPAEDARARLHTAAHEESQAR